MSHIGRKIYEIRKEHRLSQKELAAMLKVSPKAISFYENGERTPSREVLCRFSNKFGISIDFLLGFSNDPRLPAEKARDKYGFFYPKDERENIKNQLEKILENDAIDNMSDNMPDNMSIEEKIELCEKDLKQYFSRSVELLAFDLENHVDFAEFAGMLLNQKHFARRYGVAYPYLCGKYPPMPGLAERATSYKPQENQEEPFNEDILQIVDSIKNLSKNELRIVRQFIEWLEDMKLIG